MYVLYRLTHQRRLSTFHPTELTMHPPRFLSSILSSFMTLSASHAGPTTQPSGGSSCTLITKKLGVDFVRATRWAAYHPNVIQNTLRYNQSNIISYFAAYVCGFNLGRGSY